RQDRRQHEDHDNQQADHRHPLAPQTRPCPVPFERGNTLHISWFDKLHISSPPVPCRGSAEVRFKPRELQGEFSERSLVMAVRSWRSASSAARGSPRLIA